MNNKLTVSCNIDTPIENVWDYFTSPKHVIGWNFASDDWHCPTSNAELKIGGVFCHRMAAKDGSFAFDLDGFYTEIDEYSKLHYKLGSKDLTEHREVEVYFTKDGVMTRVEQHFTPENQNPLEMQQQGWQMILNNFKKYCENIDE